MNVESMTFNGLAGLHEDRNIAVTESIVESDPNKKSHGGKRKHGDNANTSDLSNHQADKVLVFVNQSLTAPYQQP